MCNFLKYLLSKDPISFRTCSLCHSFQSILDDRHRPESSSGSTISDDKLIPLVRLLRDFYSKKFYKWKFFFSCRYICLCLHMHVPHMYMYSNVFLRPSSDLEFFLNTVTYAKEDVH